MSKNPLEFEEYEKKSQIMKQIEESKQSLLDIEIKREICIALNKLVKESENDKVLGALNNWT